MAMFDNGVLDFRPGGLQKGKFILFYVVLYLMFL